jgi:signal peptidase
MGDKDFNIDDLFSEDPELRALLNRIAAPVTPDPTPPIPAPSAFAPPSSFTRTNSQPQPFSVSENTRTLPRVLSADELFGQIAIQAGGQQDENPAQTVEKTPIPAPEKTPWSIPVSAVPTPEDDWEDDWEEDEAPPNKGAKLRNLILDLLVYGMALSLILGATIFAFSNSTEKSLFGYRFYNVITPSMEPVFSPGDMIFIKICGVDEIQEGDVITFVPNKNSKAYLTHRVKKITPGEKGEAPSVVTRGDANNTDDPPISGEAVVGKYLFSIPKAGAIINFIRENIILMGICIAAAFVLLIFLRSYFAARKKIEG